MQLCMYIFLSTVEVRAFGVHGLNAVERPEWLPYEIIIMVFLIDVFENNEARVTRARFGWLNTLVRRSASDMRKSSASNHTFDNYYFIFYFLSFLISSKSNSCAIRNLENVPHGHFFRNMIFRLIEESDHVYMEISKNKTWKKNVEKWKSKQKADAWLKWEETLLTTLVWERAGQTEYVRQNEPAIPFSYEYNKIAESSILCIDLGGVLLDTVCSKQFIFPRLVYSCFTDENIRIRAG